MKLQSFRVARSGRTIDGREITPAQIDQMAKNYDPAKYGARIWLEHLRSAMPDGSFRAYGDVLSLSAETDAEGARVLIATVDATPDLMKLAADRQKVFWSIEMEPNFAGSGEAYMVGLAATDSPASLGTEMLKFSITENKLPEPLKSHLYSEAIEGEALAEAEAEKPGLFARVKELFAARAKGDDARAADIEAGVLAVAEEVGALRTAAEGFAAKGEVEAVREAANAAIAKLNADLDGVIAKLSTTPAAPTRSPVSGSAAKETDC